MKKIILLFFLTTIFWAIRGQIDSTDALLQAVEENLERFTNSEVEETALSENELELLSELESAKQTNLNTMSYEVAVLRFKLSDYQYYQLQLYIEERGQLVSVYELLAIEGFDKQIIERLLPYVTAVVVNQEQSFWKNLFRRSTSQLWIRCDRILETQAGYDTTRSNHYAGSPWHCNFRYTFNSQNKVILKVAGEKDAGEQFFRGAQRQGFDLYSGSLTFKNFGILRAAVVGDYRISSGQGLVIGSSMLSGKGNAPDGIRQFGGGVLPVAMSNEGNCLRGGALTLGNATYRGTLFAGQYFGTLQQAFGADFSCRQKLFKIGARIVGYSSLDTSLADRSAQIRSALKPDCFSASVDYQVLLRQVLLFGEVAINEQGRPGILQSFLLSLTPTSKLALVARHYDAGYNSLLGSAFRSGSSGGETGIYLTSSHILGRKCHLQFYSDYYRFALPTYRTDAPVAGLDFGATLQCQLSRTSLLSLRYIFKNKPENKEGNGHYKQLHDHLRHKVRIQWRNQLSQHLDLKTEIDWQINCYGKSEPNYQGLLLFQDLSWHCDKPTLSIHLRAAYFDTDRYEERLYAYENDLYYAFTIGSYYYKGVRGYLLLSYKYRWFSVWLRLSQTYYIDRNSIGSGQSEIDKPHKTDIKIQTMFSF